jgi:hypothetical protein
MSVVKRTGRLEKEIFYGFLLLGGFLLIHRLVSNRMIEDETDK